MPPRKFNDVKKLSNKRQLIVKVMHSVYCFCPLQAMCSGDYYVLTISVPMSHALAGAGESITQMLHRCSGGII